MRRTNPSQMNSITSIMLTICSSVFIWYATLSHERAIHVVSAFAWLIRGADVVSALLLFGLYEPFRPSSMIKAINPVLFGVFTPVCDKLPVNEACNSMSCAIVSELGRLAGIFLFLSLITGVAVAMASHERGTRETNQRLHEEPDKRPRLPSHTLELQ